jgi:hypothetical protein
VSNRESENGQCALCGQNLTWGEKMNGRLKPLSCYPCVIEIRQDLEIKNIQPFPQRVAEEYHQRLAQKEKNENHS